jgi:hypothetical protein
LHITISNLNIDQLLLPTTTTSGTDQASSSSSSSSSSTAAAGAVARIKRAVQPHLASIFLATTFFHAYAMLVVPSAPGDASFSIDTARSISSVGVNPVRNQQHIYQWLGSVEESLWILETHSYMAFFSRPDLRQALNIAAISRIIGDRDALVQFCASIPTPTLFDEQHQQEPQPEPQAEPQSIAALEQQSLQSSHHSEPLDQTLESIEGQPAYQNTFAKHDDRFFSRSQYYLRVLHLIVFNLPDDVMQERILPLVF